MYFIDQEHQRNFDALADFYEKKQTDIHYRSSIYIASVPDIYQLLDLKSPEFGPLISLSTYDDEKKMRIPSAAGLTGSTSHLVRIGLSLFRGDPQKRSTMHPAPITIGKDVWIGYWGWSCNCCGCSGDAECASECNCRRCTSEGVEEN